MPVEQLTAFNDQAYACTAAYPVDVKSLRPLSTDQLRIVYAYTRDTLLPCLAGLGVTVEDLPSQDVFVASYGGADAFDPYRGVSTGQAPYERAMKTCPQLPPADVLYGGK